MTKNLTLDTDITSHTQEDYFLLCRCLTTVRMSRSCWYIPKYSCLTSFYLFYLLHWIYIFNHHYGDFLHCRFIISSSAKIQNLKSCITLNPSGLHKDWVLLKNRIISVELLQCIFIHWIKVSASTLFSNVTELCMMFSASKSQQLFLIGVLTLFPPVPLTSIGLYTLHKSYTKKSFFCLYVCLFLLCLLKYYVTICITLSPKKSIRCDLPSWTIYRRGNCMEKWSAFTCSCSSSLMETWCIK